jgi:hypothetical protein
MKQYCFTTLAPRLLKYRCLQPSKKSQFLNWNERYFGEKGYKNTGRFRIKARLIAGRLTLQLISHYVCYFENCAAISVLILDQLSFSMYQCTSVPVWQCGCAPVYQCTNMPVYQWHCLGVFAVCSSHFLSYVSFVRFSALQQGHQLFDRPRSPMLQNQFSSPG